MVREEEYLAEFIARALPAEELSAPVLDAEEDYLALFMAHSIEQPSRSDEVLTESARQRSGLDIKYSKFVSSYSRLDPESGVSLIRLTSSTVLSEGFSVFSNDATIICYSLTGEGEVVVDGSGTRIRKYDLIWLDCACRPRFRPSPGRPWECAFVRINGELNSPLFANTCAILRERRQIHLTFGAGTRLRSLVWQLLSARTESGPDPDNMYAHLLLGLFLEVDMAITSTAVQQVIVPDIIVAIQGYIDRNYNQPISLDSLSRLFSISKYHMAREFKRYVGKSPNDYLIDVRMTRAKELLIDSRSTIAEIAQSVRISNTNHFLYLFKSREGLTPSAFRKQRV